MNYIDFFEKEIPNWMRASNQKMQEVGFATDAYWHWVVQSMADVCNKYGNDDFVKNQFGLIFDLLESKARG